MISRAVARKNLRDDVVNIVIGIFLAWFLISSGALDALFSISSRAYIAAIFIAGLFFTSAFTLAPAAIFLAELAQHAPPLTVALIGALGAMCGDLMLFLFIRDRFTEDVKGVLGRKTVQRILNSFHLGFWKWLAPLLGALIIASPLPDEFGLSLLGLSQVRIGILLPLTFVMNFLGILSVVVAANAL